MAAATKPQEEKEGLDLSGEEEAKPAEEKRGRGRPSSATKTRDLKTRISETLTQLAEMAEKLGDDELAGVLKEDGPKMAAWFAHHAEKRARLAKVLGRLVGEGSAGDFLRAFGRLLRVLQSRVGQALPRPVIGGEPEEGEEPEPESAGGLEQQ